ncbi:alpha/beta-type small acid-soluble spore protein [Clostridium sp. Cult3]|uniref:alpha/beta-type small acid-soluble spore protein n=1 Tax=Clostridium sp. Cult3 TaxID=2079004 RepID=UPI001F2F3350|nr:alpha/beta-type small acid-soluble spore protein [Clostridium sp. Cult3]MCF6460620.1 acid-soluble spore protein [Clostridium sp. Cult3]
MTKGPLDPNAIEALNEMKLEIAKELGISEDFMNNNNVNPATNIFTAGPVGGLMTRRLVEMGEKQLIDEE